MVVRSVADYCTVDETVDADADVSFRRRGKALICVFLMAFTLAIWSSYAQPQRMHMESEPSQRHVPSAGVWHAGGRNIDTRPYEVNGSVEEFPSCPGGSAPSMVKRLGACALRSRTLPKNLGSSAAEANLC